MNVICKVYKPEIMQCPICGSKLVYCYAISNKLVYFTSGKRFRIKNLGYSCPHCNNNIYFSQTANKLCFKGHSYSAKVFCLIAYFKWLGKSRNEICDYFSQKEIDISDRNVDNLYNKFQKLYNDDYQNKIDSAIKNMLTKFNEIRFSIDVITINKVVFIILYDFFTGEILALKKFDTITDPEIENFLKIFINKENNITIIATIRKDAVFVPLLKKLVPAKTKIIAFNKF